MAHEADQATALRRRRVPVFVVLSLGLAIAALLSIGLGARPVGWDAIRTGLLGHTETVSQAAVAQRVPRTLLAALAGAALGVSGTIMQAVTRNPLADPGILGVNAGASLAVMIGLAWFSIGAAQSFIWLGILGAAVSACFVYLVGSLGPGGGSPLNLALAGAATSIAISSIVMAIILPRPDIAESAQAWHIGGVGGASWTTLSIITPFLALGLGIALILSRVLNVLAMGDEIAVGLGEKVVVARLVCAAAAVILCGATTAICGPIGFVGLVVPHVCRVLSGIDHRRLLPFSALAGASFLLLCDTIGRVVARPTEIQVGIVTALIGGPFFIHVVRRQKVRSL